MTKTTSISLITCTVLIGFLTLLALPRHMTAEPNADSKHKEHKKHEEHKNETHGKHESSGSKQETEDEGHQSIKIPPARRKKMGVQIATPQPGTAHSRFVRPATVRFDPDRQAKVGPVVQGRVQEVMVVPGDQVKKGEPVARLHSVKLGKAKAAYLSEKAHVKSRKAEYERQKTLRKKKINSESELDLARAKYLEARSNLNEAKEQLKIYGLTKKAIEQLSFSSDRSLATTVLRAPMRGVVQKRSMSKGDIVRPGDQPIHIVQNDTVWIMTDAYEKDIAHIEKGNKITFRTEGVNGTTFTGKVEWMSLELDENSRTAKVRAVVENKHRLLRAGMYGEATVHTEPERAFPMVPAGAVQKLHGKQMLFVPGKHDHEFTPVPVQVGNESQDGWVEIRKGLHMDQKYVRAGAFDLKSVFTARSRSAAHSH
jgi:cobalt-zinc-cadmium efflux system membrane fusion protein